MGCFALNRFFHCTSADWNQIYYCSRVNEHGNIKFMSETVLLKN